MSTNANGHSNGILAAPAVIDAPASSAAPSKIQPNDVGWQFVPQYYNFVNKQPHRLHCFYNKRSTFINGEEGEDSSPALGQQEIHDRIKAIGYEDCKVYIHSIDSQSSAGGGIIILVIGEMSNRGQTWRKFTQTFFLAEQPNGYFVLNDIFRYLKEEEADEQEEGEAVEAVPVTKVDVHIDAPIESVEATKPKEEEVEAKSEEKVEPTPEPEPVSAPSAPATKEVPIEAVAAAVPDKDIAPSEPAAVEEPAAPAPSAPAVEAPKPTSPAPAKAEAPNGSSAKPSAPAAPTPAPAAAAPAAPAAPAKPAAPRSWAAMAAGNAAAKPAAAAAPAPAAAPAAPAQSTSAPAQKKEEAPAASSSGRNQAFDNANRVQTSHCFVKLPNWSLENQSSGETIDEAAIKATAIRFGDVSKVEIVKQKACAFVEFTKVESARKAIIASLPTSQGGEGGVKIQGAEGRLNFETRKEKDERKKGTGQSPTQSSPGSQQGQQGQGGQGGGRGGRTDRGGAGAGGRGGRGGRGRGGAQQGGQAQKA